MRFFSRPILFVSRCISGRCVEPVGLYIANVLTFKRITTPFAVVYHFVEVGLYIANVLTFKRITTARLALYISVRWTLYCKCTNFQANHNVDSQIQLNEAVGLYIANVLTFKRITTVGLLGIDAVVLDSILQMY